MPTEILTNILTPLFSLDQYDQHDNNVPEHRSAILYGRYYEEYDEDSPNPPPMQAYLMNRGANPPDTTTRFIRYPPHVNSILRVSKLANRVAKPVFDHEAIYLRRWSCDSTEYFFSDYLPLYNNISASHSLAIMIKKLELNIPGGWIEAIYPETEITKWVSLVRKTLPNLQTMTLYTGFYASAIGFKAVKVLQRWGTPFTKPVTPYRWLLNLACLLYAATKLVGEYPQLIGVSYARDSGRQAPYDPWGECVELRVTLHDETTFQALLKNRGAVYIPRRKHTLITGEYMPSRVSGPVLSSRWHQH